MAPFDPARFCIRADASIREAVATIDRNETGIALVVDEERRLVGTVTDGDVRRAMLNNVSLDEPVERLLRAKANSKYARPITADPRTPLGELIARMQRASIRQLPIVDASGRVVDLVTLDHLAPEASIPVQAVVMAGGFGTRLRPLTDKVPKPMLPVGDKPILERIIDQLRASGVRKVNVTTHYMPEQIVDHFGDGGKFGVDIQYVNEAVPLGTAGALSLIDKPSTAVLIVNGDILTDLNYRALLAYHQEHEADMTVGVHNYEFRVPYGVIESGPTGEIIGLSEKPTLRFFVNAGIYLIEPHVYDYVEGGRRLDMTDLIARLIADKKRVVSFPIRESWLDIGQPADYARAQEIVAAPRHS